MGLLSILATTDVHAVVRDFDYVADAPYAYYGHRFGLARASSVIAEIRRERGAESVVLLDNGDMLQGSPLANFHGQTQHPLAVVTRAMGYDAVCLGNHDLNDGLDALLDYAVQLRLPVLAANLVGLHDGFPVTAGSTVLDRVVDGRPVRVGVVGITTPGSLRWDRRHLAGRATILDPVSTARAVVRRLRAQGADVVVVLAHSGIGASTYDEDSTGPENVAEVIAHEVAGIDVVVVGHTHAHDPGRRIVGPDGRDVCLIQPRYWASTIADVQLDLTWARDILRVRLARSCTHSVAQYSEDPAVVALVEPAHQQTRLALATQVAWAPQKLTTETSPWEPTAALDLVAHTMAEAVRTHLARTEHAHLPVVSLTAPVTRTACLGPGPVRLSDLVDLYPYASTVVGVRATGADLRAHLEHAAAYYADVAPGAVFDPDTMTSATRDGVTRWDYLYDVALGVRYCLDIARPVGSRVVALAWPDGAPVADDDGLVLALDSNRVGGGGGYPAHDRNTWVHDDGQKVCAALLAWVQAHPVLLDGAWPRARWCVVVGQKWEPTMAL